MPIGLWADLKGAEGTALNGGAGSVKIVLPGYATYTSGVKQRISVPVSDPAQRRWGFELTARLVSNLSSGQAGDLTPADSNTRVICDNGRSNHARAPQRFNSSRTPKPGPDWGLRVGFVRLRSDATFDRRRKRPAVRRG